MPAYRTRDNSSRSLEVTTDLQPPPTVAVISPTPRAFSFPASAKSRDDSPFASPSTSPFEPDLRTLALTCTPPPPPLISTTSLSASLPTSHTLPQHKRRNSASADLERRPKKGDEDYIKRPENAFILFRRKCCEDRQQAQDESATSADGPAKKQRQADLSKTISQQWKSLPAEDRQYWEDLAKEKKREHEQMYPNYVYRPQRTKGKEDKTKGKKPLKAGRASEAETDSDSVSFVLPIPSHNRHGRSSSAPSGYQQITVPNVYMPSCPTSPNLLPLIARRSSHPGHHPVISQFDFVPTTDSLPPQSSYAAPFEPSNSFFQDMFNVQGQHSLSPQHQPLDVACDGALLMPPNVLSPSSSVSSGSASPSSAPFTPTHTFPFTSDEISPINAFPPESVLSEPGSSEVNPIDLGYGAFGWDNSLWSDAATQMLQPEDLDINTIGPIELNGPVKYDGDVAQMGVVPDNCPLFTQGFMEESFPRGHIPRHDSLEGLFGFPGQLMVGPGF